LTLLDLRVRLLLAIDVLTMRRGSKLSDDEGRQRPPVIGIGANHFQLAFTETEFLLDFGQAYGDPGEPVIHTRIIMTLRSARTLCRMMQELVEKFDSTAGVRAGEGS
jgi:hypothetical protein